jgi:acetylornithine deacetylase/succinyl-diaminopimelate desuccinylase-like protein
VGPTNCGCFAAATAVTESAATATTTNLRITLPRVPGFVPFRARKIASLAVRMTAQIAINDGRLVDWASRAIGTPSFTGSEQAMGELMAETFESMGLQVQWQQVEDGRPNVVGTWPGAGGGRSLMFNGHMDTSYSGREPWLKGVRGFQPSAFVKDGRLFGLGISNMKGALACYVEALRALQDAGVRLKGVRTCSASKPGRVEVPR